MSDYKTSLNRDWDTVEKVIITINDSDIELKYNAKDKIKFYVDFNGGNAYSEDLTFEQLLDFCFDKETFCSPMAKSQYDALMKNLEVKKQHYATNLFSAEKLNRELKQKLEDALATIRTLTDLK